MPFFISCSVPKVKYLRGEYIYNKPINLSLCKSISKTQTNWYPDNTGLPSITFHGCNQEWAYNNKEEREIDYLKIINNEFNI